ncbi:hypothetical protein ABH935_001777 [Catenulispora sp. GAS73]
MPEQRIQVMTGTPARRDPVPLVRDAAPGCGPVPINYGGSY